MSKLFFSLLLIAGISFSTFAQKIKTFEGQITYAIDYKSEVDPQMKAQLPTEIVMFIKGTNTRMEQISPMGKVVVINNSQTKLQSVLLDIMGQKYALKTTAEETEKSLAEMEKATVAATTETKTIAGQNCVKYDITFKGKTESYWATKELDLITPNWNMPWSEVPGILMEYTQEQGEVKQSIIAKEVKKEKVKDSMFEVPAEYQVMSMEEFKSMFGGGE